MANESDSDMVIDSAGMDDTSKMTLDQAIEYCVTALERGDRHLDQLPSKFPKWENEIREFLANWGSMEELAVGLSEPFSQLSELADQDPLPRDFAHFELLELIGCGGMGVIYRARQKILDRIVALKVLRSDANDLERFRMEAEAAASLSHSHIVSIYEIGIHEGAPWLSMQYVEGSNLKQIIDEHGLTGREAAEMMRLIASAVHHAHQRGILHRDLKPANVLVNENREPFVTDFGLAKVLDHDIEVTRSGTILGTPGYMSPEQANGDVRSLTVATDIYGLGALLFAMLTGEAPFVGDSSLNVLRKVVDDPAPSPRLRNPSVDRDLETICLKCLEKDPESRYASAEQLAADLGRHLAGQPVHARPISSMERFFRWCRRNPTIAFLSAAVLFLLLASTVFGWSYALSQRRARILASENGEQEARHSERVQLLYDQQLKATKDAIHSQLNLMTANGLWQAGLHRAGDAMLWFSAAARHASAQPEQQKRMLIHLQSWLDHHPLPIDAFLLPSEFCRLDDVESMESHDQEPCFLYRSGRQFLYWNVATRTKLHINALIPSLTWATWDADGGSLLAGSADGTLYRVNPESGAVNSFAKSNSHVVRMVLMDGNRILVVAHHRELEILDRESGVPVHEAMALEHTVRDVRRDPRGTRLIITDSARKTTVYTMESAGLSRLYEQACEYRSLMDGAGYVFPLLLEQGKVLLTRTTTGRCIATELDSGRVLNELEFPYPVYSVDADTHSNVVVTGQHDSASLTRFRANQDPEETGVASLTVDEVRQLAHQKRVSAVAVSSEGLIATAGWDNEVRIWDPNPGQAFVDQVYNSPEKVAPLVALAHQNRLRRASFSAGGRYLVTIQIDGLVRVWSIPEVRGVGRAIQVEAGGSLVKAAGDRWMTSGISQWSGHVRTPELFDWDAETRTPVLPSVDQDSQRHLLDAACSPDTKQVAMIYAGKGRSGKTFGAKDGTGGELLIHDASDPSKPRIRIPMPSEPRWVAYRPDGGQIAVCTALMEIVLVDAATFEVVATLDALGDEKKAVSNSERFPQNPVNEHIAYTPDGKTLVAWSTRKSGVAVWDVENRVLRYPRVHANLPPLASASLSPDGRLLAMALGQTAAVEILELDTGRILEKRFEHPAFVHHVQFSPDGTRLVTTCRDGYARVIAWKTGAVELDRLSHDGDVISACFTHEGHYVITIGLDDMMKVWHVDDGNIALRPIPIPAGSSQILLKSDSQQVVIAGGQPFVIDLQDLQRAPGLTLERARQTSEILAAKSIVNGVTQTLSSSEWLARWKSWLRD